MRSGRELLRSPVAPLLAALVVMVPTLFAGLAMDDVLMRVRLLGVDTAWGTAWWDLFTFARPELNAELRALGLHPWWADPAVSMSFFRPLAAATHVLDYALWPESPVLQHLHSVAWYVACVAAAWLVYGRLEPDAPDTRRGLASLVFALAAPHVLTVGWIAARNTLIAFVFGCGLLAFHVRGREQDTLGPKLAGVSTLAVGLLASEAMLGALGYVLAWQLCMERGSWMRRLAALWPYALVVIGWRLAYVAAGFGSAAGGIYHDPGSDPLAFLAALATNLPVLLSCRWLLIPVDGWAITSVSVHAAQLGLACVVLPALAALLWPQLRADPRARFWAVGMVVSLIPFTATMPMDRLVLFAGLGFAALVAGLADQRFDSRAARIARVGLLVLHLPLSGVFGLARGATLEASVAFFTSGLDQAPRDAEVPEQTFVYVTGTFHRVHYTTLMRASVGDPAVPRRSVVLASLVSDVTLTRTGERSVEIHSPEGYMLYDLDRIHRRDASSMMVGERIGLPDLEVEILELGAEGRPTRVGFHFERALEDPSLRWLSDVPGDGGLFPFGVETRAFELPAIGERVELESVLP